MRLLKENQIKPLQGLGQNFLIDGNILEKIVTSADLTEEDKVLEIGPGLGTVTQFLAEDCSKVIAIEIDERLISILKKHFYEHTNVEIIKGDVLEVDLSEIFMKAPYGWKVIANLPYYITSPILMKLLMENANIDLMVLMVQREVAHRIIAQPGGKEYGVLSVLVQYYYDAHVIHNVPPTVFFPKPDVDSSVVLLERCKARRVYEESERYFACIVKAAFGKRRKTLLNALSNNSLLPMDKGLILDIFQEAKIDPKDRAEILTIDDFVRISCAVAKRFI